MYIIYTHLQIYNKNLKYKPVANFDLGPGFTHSRVFWIKKPSALHMLIWLSIGKNKWLIVVNSGS